MLQKQDSNIWSLNLKEYTLPCSSLFLTANPIKQLSIVNNLFITTCTTSLLLSCNTNTLTPSNNLVSFTLPCCEPKSQPLSPTCNSPLINLIPSQVSTTSSPYPSVCTHQQPLSLTHTPPPATQHHLRQSTVPTQHKTYTIVLPFIFLPHPIANQTTQHNTKHIQTVHNRYIRRPVSNTNI